MSKKSILQKFQRGGVVLNLQPPGQILEKAVADLIDDYQYRVRLEHDEREAAKDRQFQREEYQLEREFKKDQQKIKSKSDMDMFLAEREATSSQLDQSDVMTVLSSDLPDNDKARAIRVIDESGAYETQAVSLEERSKATTDISTKLDRVQSHDDLLEVSGMINKYPGLAPQFGKDIKTKQGQIAQRDVLLRFVDDPVIKKYFGNALTADNINAVTLDQIPALMNMVKGRSELAQYDRKEKIDILQNQIKSIDNTVDDYKEEGKDYSTFLGIKMELMERLDNLLGMDKVKKEERGISDVDLMGEPAKQEPPSLEDAEYIFTGPGGRTQTVQGLKKATQLYNAGWTYEQPRYNINLYGVTDKSPPKNLVPIESIVKGPDGKRYQYIGFEEGQLSKEERLSLLKEGLRGGELEAVRKAKNKMYLKDSEGKTVSVSARESNNYQVVPGNFLSKPDDFPDNYWNRVKDNDKELVSRQWYDLSEEDKRNLLNEWANK